MVERTEKCRKKRSNELTLTPLGEKKSLIREAETTLPAPMRTEISSNNKRVPQNHDPPKNGKLHTSSDVAELLCGLVSPRMVPAFSRRARSFSQSEKTRTSRTEKFLPYIFVCCQSRRVNARISTSSPNWLRPTTRRRDEMLDRVARRAVLLFLKRA